MVDSYKKNCIVQNLTVLLTLIIIVCFLFLFVFFRELVIVFTSERLIEILRLATIFTWFQTSIVCVLINPMYCPKEMIAIDNACDQGENHPFFTYNSIRNFWRKIFFNRKRFWNLLFLFLLSTISLLDKLCFILYRHFLNYFSASGNKDEIIYLNLFFLYYNFHFSALHLNILVKIYIKTSNK